MNGTVNSTNLKVSAIPSQDLIAARDLLHDCSSALECIFMAATSFEKEEANAIQYIARLAQENIGSIKDLLAGAS